MRNLIERLTPYAQGCFSGHVSEWPDLKPILSECLDAIQERDQLLADKRELVEALEEAKGLLRATQHVLEDGGEGSVVDTVWHPERTGCTLWEAIQEVLRPELEDGSEQLTLPGADQ